MTHKKAECDKATAKGYLNYSKIIIANNSKIQGKH